MQNTHVKENHVYILVRLIQAINRAVYYLGLLCSNSIFHNLHCFLNEMSLYTSKNSMQFECRGIQIRYIHITNPVQLCMWRPFGIMDTVLCPRFQKVFTCIILRTLTFLKMFCASGLRIRTVIFTACEYIPFYKGWQKLSKILETTLRSNFFNTEVGLHFGVNFTLFFLMK